MSIFATPVNAAQPFNRNTPPRDRDPIPERPRPPPEGHP